MYMPPSLSPRRCRIYKVPYHLRNLNEEAYTPHVISIGPIHHNNERVQTMEKHKERYFEGFRKRAGINLEILESSIREMEDSIRRCYVGTILPETEDFVKLIRLDASFILELFLRYYEDKWEVDDPVLVEAWLLDVMRHELLLLENQLPFSVIGNLYDLAFPNNTISPSLIRLSFYFFGFLNIHGKAHPDDQEIQHFTDLLRFFQLPPNPNAKHYRSAELSSREMIFPKYSATQLREAGITFTKASREYAFNNGELEIPLLKFQDGTEALIRNTIALEQCDSSIDTCITEFYIILDHLINTSKDVDLLSDEGIIDNMLGDSNAVTSMINNLNKGIFKRNLTDEHNELCRDLNAFYEFKWHKWIFTLKHEYFRTPWGTATSTAGIILLVLTLIQTICSIIQIV